ncbi:MAG: hypothetical protein ACRCSL_16855 [Microbacterium sp.]
MNNPSIASKRVPGLVMWPNGTIVTVRLREDGTIERDRRGDAIPLQVHGRWTGEHAGEVFVAIELRLMRDAHETRKYN